MKHCTQCGVEVNSGGRYCHNCGSALQVSANNTSIDANLKVDITNKTAEKVIDSFSSSISSGVGVAKKATSSLWKLFLRLAVITIALSVVFFIAVFIYRTYENHEIEQSKKKLAQERQALADKKDQELRERIYLAKERSGKWIVRGEVDPASDKKIARTASITSEDGLCEMAVQKRINGNQLTGLDCIGVKISPSKDVYIKFDTNEESRTMNIEKYTDSDRVYISYFDQSSYDRHMSYESFISGLLTNNKVAIEIPTDDRFWARFTLNGCTDAINLLGKEIK